MIGQPADIDQRIADNSDKALVASFRREGAPNDPDGLPLRPDFGTDGTEISLRTNFFPVHVALDDQGQHRKWYGYHVAITPVVGSRRLVRRIYDLAERTAEWAQAGMVGNVVHDDGARLFAACPLPQPLTIRVPYYNEGEMGAPQHGGRVYNLTISLVEGIYTEELARC